MAFGNKVFGQTYFAEPTVNPIISVPGFTAGFSIAASAAAVAAIAAGVASGVDARVAAASGRDGAGSRATIRAVPGSAAEIIDEQGGYPT